METTLVEPRLLLWTKDEYYKMAEIGFFDGKRVELIGGQVLEMSPMLSGHATATMLVAEALRKAFASRHFLRVQLPLSVSEISDPEPDVAVIEGTIRDYRDAHPTTAALVVEVADSSVDYDRTDKASLYASAGVGDYWVVNLPQRRLEVFRSPIPDTSQPFGYSHASRTIFAETEQVQPLAAAGVVQIADLLP
ncbi:MAG: Uma2 family endonuclease [Caldilineaceae bacterium]|nr:Uma2 family endonuclease [Caldilineaceae bacterium]HRJ41073.1 Uma2 family endonuclease [Caldilineaceae bacterium]